ncbi:Nif11-like leader peptide family RiPP precursor [Desulfovibrio sp. JC010]|uniref:Nif11-like leader peptide family RiPP precursor n=1 Tax=Desulfovibrio sp. JC010 TaxID=2593641 RepID=UPI0013D6E11F|nr:Nif11-like leader peptide family RiPP precursor [Desulfovibrio sp. JC010]NDV27680.1 Nif11-like leader peptide family natural product precursor [Desulfovibrio sp. JC010]
MSIEAANGWIIKINEDDVLRQQADKIENFDDWQKLAREQGFEFSKEEMEKAIANASGELADDDLDNISGGETKYTPGINISNFHAPGISIGGGGSGMDMNMDMGDLDK